MRLSATLKWLGLALLGILIAAAVAVAASRLVSRQIGLASEPISAGDALAPRVVQPSRAPAGHSQTGNRPTTTGVPTVTVAPPEPTTTTPGAEAEPQTETEPQAEGGDDRGSSGRHSGHDD